MAVYDEFTHEQQHRCQHSWPLAVTSATTSDLGFSSAQKKGKVGIVHACLEPGALTSSCRCAWWVWGWILGSTEPKCRTLEQLTHEKGPLAELPGSELDPSWPHHPRISCFHSNRRQISLMFAEGSDLYCVFHLTDRLRRLLLPAVLCEKTDTQAWRWNVSFGWMFIWNVYLHLLASRILW